MRTSARRSCAQSSIGRPAPMKLVAARALPARRLSTSPIVNTLCCRQTRHSALPTLPAPMTASCGISGVTAGVEPPSSRRAPSVAGARTGAAAATRRRRRTWPPGCGGSAAPHASLYRAPAARPIARAARTEVSAACGFRHKAKPDNGLPSRLPTTAEPRPSRQCRPTLRQLLITRCVSSLLQRAAERRPHAGKRARERTILQFAIEICPPFGTEDPCRGTVAPLFPGRPGEWRIS